jgi:hypothetical protein
MTRLSIKELQKELGTRHLDPIKASGTLLATHYQQPATQVI